MSKRTGEWTFYYTGDLIAAKGNYDDDGWPISNTWKTYDAEGNINIMAEVLQKCKFYR
ncbi:hypothetical protein OQX61_21035 [Pedobacter sp. PLR]|uniref:hypothetical protein n=1 Tax=Pedobacter sp. PLR TaxID=2994465 RepID=UPI002247DB00|nr:hypothetical protein [Pedobacter sp. PLR]MCX2453768.1 hypothetical protein [Pedobacter sp. PLR]